MTIKHLQLNTSLMKDPVGIVEYVEGNAFDVVCMQEICYPIGQQNELERLFKERGYYYEEGIHFQYLPDNSNLGVAIVSKYPIIDFNRVYWNSDDYQPKVINNDSFLGKSILDDTVTRKDEFQGSRGIRHSAKSRCILMCLVDTPQGKIRIVTTHFTVSDLCTETVQMYDISKLVTSLIGNSKAIPTIFSADLNIRAQSYSVSKLKEVLTCHTQELTDTLSDSHIAKKHDFPEGLAIDHVFSKGFELIALSEEETDLSEHKSIISTFKLIQ